MLDLCGGGEVVAEDYDVDDIRVGHFDGMVDDNEDLDAKSLGDR